MALDSIAVLNLVFDLVVLGVGACAYLRMRRSAPLWIGVGFGFFGLSYVLTLMGFGESSSLLVPFRGLGYVSVIGGLALLLLRPMARRATSSAPAS